MVKIYQTHFDYCTFRLAQLMHIVVYFLIVYGLLRYFKQISCDGGLLNPARPVHYPYQFHHRQSYAQKVKSKHSPIKNLSDRHVHISLSNVVINIHYAGNYQLEIVFLRARLRTSDLTVLSCFCSKIKRHTQLIVA